MREIRVGVLAALVVGCGGLSAAEEGSEWWSWRALARPEVPEVSGDVGVVDAFVLEKLGEKGLEMNGEARREVLARRLYFDLLGLPPSREEVEAFVRDESEGAYGRLVERLLASPRYGERWARHWLDVVHFGETHGYDKDKLRPNAWPYRDYVIRAFNEDKPYGRFVREQLAGDVFWPGTVDGVVATGFIAAGPWDFIGHAEVPEEKIDGKIARHLDRDDMVTTAMNAFCSLTVQCAQCHDHKIDPVTMRDYYSLQAVFAAVDRADREYDADPAVGVERERLREEIARLEGEEAMLGEKIESAKTEEIRALEVKLAGSGEVEGGARSNRYGYHSQVAREQGAVKWVQVDLGEEVAIDRVVLVGADEYGFADFGFPHRFRVEVSQSADFAEKVVLADETGGDFARPGGAPVGIAGGDGRARFVRVTATKLWSRRHKGQALSGDWIFALGELAVLSGGKLVEVKAVTAKDSIEALPRWGKADLIDGIYGKFARGEEGLLAWLEEDLGELRAEKDRLMREVAGVATDERDGVRKELERLKGALGRLPKPGRVYAGTVHTGSGAFKGRGHVGGKPREIFVLARGEVTKPGEPVGPGTVPGIVGDGSFKLGAGHAEGERRAALAEWVTHPENGLTWRSIVNRVWQYHFGRGIVDTPNDFGRIGGEPSHPELLEWLAVEFRDGGGSIKDLHRLILNSAAYKQSSEFDAASAAVDGSNQYLWRQNRRRLEAEAVRDSVLAVAGKLDLKMGGPSFQDFVIEKPEHSPHYEYEKYDVDDAATHRRSVYRFLVRSQPQPFMDTMDCADPSQLVDKRGETTTALQALAMLNNRFMVRMAEHFAARIEGESDVVGAAIRLGLSREATAEEREVLGAYAGEHGVAAMCRVILNLSEFVYVD